MTTIVVLCVSLFCFFIVKTVYDGIHLESSRVNTQKFRVSLLKAIRRQGYRCEMEEERLKMFYDDESFSIFLRRSLNGNKVVKVVIVNAYSWDGFENESFSEHATLSSLTGYEYPIISHVNTDSGMYAVYQMDVHSVKDVTNGLSCILNCLVRAELFTRENYKKLIERDSKSETQEDQHICFKQHVVISEDNIFLHVAAENIKTKLVEERHYSPEAIEMMKNRMKFVDSGSGVSELEQYAEKNWSRYPNPDASYTSTTDDAIGTQDNASSIVAGVVCAIIVIVLFFLYKILI